MKLKLFATLVAAACLVGGNEEVQAQSYKNMTNELEALLIRPNDYFLGMTGAVMNTRIATASAIVRGGLSGGVDGGRITNILNGFVTPYDMGAVGDGIADDTVPLQKWLTIASWSNWVAFMPPARGSYYKITDALWCTNLPAYPTIIGAGGQFHASSTPLSRCQIHQATVGKHGIIFTGPNGAIDNTANGALDGIQIRGILITGPSFGSGMAPVPGHTYGIGMLGSGVDSDCDYIESVGALGFDYGLVLGSVADVVVKSCSFGWNNNGIIVGMPPELVRTGTIINNVLIEASQVSYNITNQIYLANGSRIKIQNCDVAPGAGQGSDNGATGILVKGAGSVTVETCNLENDSTNAFIVVTTNNPANPYGSTVWLKDCAVSSPLNGAKPNTYSLKVTNNYVFTYHFGVGATSSTNGFPILEHQDDGDPHVYSMSWDMSADLFIKPTPDEFGSTLNTNYTSPLFSPYSSSAPLKDGQLTRKNHWFSWTSINVNPATSSYENNNGGDDDNWALLYPARLYGFTGNRNQVMLDLLRYHKDLMTTITANSLSVTNTSYFSNNVGIAGLLLRSNTLALKPVQSRGDIWNYVSNGVWFVVIKKPNGQEQTNLVSRYSDADVQSFFDTAGSTVTNNPVICTAIQQLVDDYKQNGWWTITDIIYPLVGNSNACRLNLKQRQYDLTFNSASGFTFNWRGVKGDGTGYADTGFNPSTAGGQYALNSCHLFTSIGSQASSSGTEVFLGGYANGDPRAYLQFNGVTVVRAVSLNAANASVGDDSNDDNLGRGGFIATRTSSTTASEMRRASAQINTSITTTTLPNCSFLVWARGTGTSPAFDNQAPIEMRGVSIGGGITDCAAFLAMWDRFNRALGRGTP